MGIGVISVGIELVDRVGRSETVQLICGDYLDFKIFLSFLVSPKQYNHPSMGGGAAEQFPSTSDDWIRG